MQFISFVEQLSKTIKFFALFITISAITIVVCLLVKNLWILGDNPSAADPQLSVQYEYYRSDSSQSNALPISTPQQLISNTQKYDSNLFNTLYWVKLKITNNTSQDAAQVIYIDAPTENIISLYRPTTSAANNADEMAENIKRENSAFQHMFPHLNVNIAANDSVTFFIQLKGYTNRLSAVHVYDTAYFDLYIHCSLALFGAFIAVVLFITKYSVFLYISLNDKVYFSYAIYLIVTFLVFATTNSFGYLIFSDEFQYLLNQQALYFQYALNICLIIFSLYFLQDKMMSKKSYRIKLGLCIAAFICVIFGAKFVVDDELSIFLWLQPLLCLFCLFIVFKNINKKFSWAKFYYISWFPFLAGLITQHLILIGYVEATFVGKNSFILGVILQVDFIALALTERMRKNEQDKVYHLSHHTQTGLPRQLNLTNAIKTLHKKSNASKDFCVVVIQPEHIENIKHYVDDKTILTLFKQLNTRLSRLFNNNNAVLPITLNNEKLCYVHGKCIGFILHMDLLNESTEMFVQSIQEIIKKTYSIKDLNLSLTGVIGIAQYPLHGTNSKDLVKNAVLAIKAAENTPQKWSFYETHTPDNSTFLLELASDIQKALINEEFELYHQPQVDLKTSKVCGSECLIRWKHPVRGFISPMVFIPVAEDMGLINKITLWVLHKALAQHTLIMENHRSHMISINISGINLTSKDFYQEMLSLIDSYDIPTEKIIFEITESANIAKNEHAVQVIDKFTALGIKVSIDDFGTGYSSLANLDKLPFQELKIDKQFVENIHHDDKRRVIAETTVKMAKGVGLEVVAEGLTTAEDEKTLTAFGCDIGQGYYYSAAIPINEYLTWLSAQVNGRVPEDFYGEYIPKST